MQYGFYLKKFWFLYLCAAALCFVAAMATSEAVTTIAENTPIARDHVIVIDAGHGGEDGGAISISGALESQINLQIALRLNDLCHLLGYKTKMIRTTDVSVHTTGNTIAEKKISDLRNRVKMVNETTDAILISIHQNIFPAAKYKGAQVFYADNASSKALAQSMQTAFVHSINPNSNRKCKPAEGVYLMQHVACPGVLVECGFLSNPEEEVLLRSAQYQQKICCVIVSALSSYLGT